MPHTTDTDRVSSERGALVAAAALTVVTSIHHVYGAIRYETPARYHAAVIAVAALVAMVVARRLSLSRPGSVSGRTASWIFIAVSATVFLLLFGVAEGLYNHTVKNILYFAGTPMARMRALFPAPTYEMPNDLFFEVTGVLQVLPGATVAYYLRRLLRSRLRRGAT